MNASLTPRSAASDFVMMALVLILAMLITVAGLASPAPASAASSTSSTSQASPDGDWPRMEQLAARDGAVRVIVTLDTPAVMPHTLPESALRNQKSAVVRDRNTLRRELGNRKLRSLKVMDDMPLVAFSATARDIAALKESEVVSSVAIDEERSLPSPHVDKDSSEPTAKPTKSAGVEPAQPAGTTSNGFHNQLSQWWDYYRIGVDKAAGAGYGGNGQVVAVLDTGVDRYHPWLQGDVVAEACFATNAAGNGGSCPNGSWYQYGTGAAAPCQQTACSHGTHVAHTAAGTYGVASGARLIAVQVFHPTSDGPRTWDSDLTWGLKYVYDLRTAYRIASVNMSLGGGAYSGYCDSSFTSTSPQGKVLGWMRSLAGVGIATVVASGNDNYSKHLGQPACFSTAISVGNTTLTSTNADAVFGNASYVGADGRTYWTGSNSNSTLDLLAPGTDICSAMPNNMMSCSMSGTSMAAPHVAGAFAVLRQSRPGATIQKVVAALHQSGTSVYDGRNGITRTRINVYRALGIIHQM